MSGVGDLFTLAEEYLAACEQAVATSPGGAIARSYIAPGPPSVNCPPELTVYVVSPAEADTRPLAPPLASGQRAGMAETGSVHLVRLAAQITRCVPSLNDDGSFPDIAAEEAAAVETIGDVWAVVNYVRALYRARLIFTDPDDQQREVWWEPAVPLAPSGGAAGWVIPVRVRLDGYGPEVTP